MGMFAASKAVESLGKQAETVSEHCTWLLLIESDMLLKMCGRLGGRTQSVGCVCVCVCVCGV